MGSDQTGPFVVFPADWPLENQPIVGDGAVYALFKRWITAQQPEVQPRPSSAGRASDPSRESMADQPLIALQNRQVDQHCTRVGAQGNWPCASSSTLIIAA